MRENMKVISNMIEECQAHITRFNLGALKEAKALLKKCLRESWGTPLALHQVGHQVLG